MIFARVFSVRGAGSDELSDTAIIVAVFVFHCLMPYQRDHVHTKSGSARETDVLLATCVLRFVRSDRNPLDLRASPRSRWSVSIVESIRIHALDRLPRGLSGSPSPLPLPTSFMYHLYARFMHKPANRECTAHVAQTRARSSRDS